MRIPVARVRRSALAGRSPVRRSSCWRSRSSCRRERPGQITRMRRKVLATNQSGLDGVAVGGEIVAQTAETEEAILAGLIA